MFSFGDVLDLPLIWGFLIALSVFIYVVLDGFDLGCGILFPFAPSHNTRTRIMNSIAPFWDGNETWIVLGGGGLFAAFPVAYGIIMSGLYIPVTLMLFGLIFRGVAFEFRAKADSSRYIWDWAFFGGSLLASIMQGVMLGALIQGLDVDTVGRVYSGSGFEWLTPFCLLTGLAVAAGYTLLGATWLVIRTEDYVQTWARQWAKRALIATLVAMVLVSLYTLILDINVSEIWFSAPTVFFLAPLPLLAIVLFYLIRKDLHGGIKEYSPFLMSLVLFAMAYIGVCVSIFPYIVPYAMTMTEAAAADTSLSLMLIGAVIMLPIILSYTAYAYFIFRGKVDHYPLY